MPPTDRLRFAPRGWQTKLPPGSGLERESHVAHEREQWQQIWEPFIRRLNDGGVASEIPNDPDHSRIEDHNTWMTYAYVLALAAHNKSSLKVLDYGGNLGYFYGIGKALLPGVALEYHCRELPEIARLGRELSPKVIWHTDDACLDQQYDLVILSSVLEYVQDWQALLHKASHAARFHVFLAGTPVVARVASYVAIQQLSGTMMLYQPINKAELRSVITSGRLRLVREFQDVEHQYIDGAPEQPCYYGCLLQREQGAA
ncbi:MAG: hypothetical protein EXR27_19415 [Betaproteobacteria bacterium]|nr:hypothetical protein [Betaproteobacteria bacterium]